MSEKSKNCEVEMERRKKASMTPSRYIQYTHAHFWGIFLSTTRKSIYLSIDFSPGWKARKKPPVLVHMGKRVKKMVRQQLVCLAGKRKDTELSPTFFMGFTSFSHKNVAMCGGGGDGGKTNRSIAYYRFHSLYSSVASVFLVHISI